MILILMKLLLVLDSNTKHRWNQRHLHTTHRHQCNSCGIKAEKVSLKMEAKQSQCLMIPKRFDQKIQSVPTPALCPSISRITSGWAVELRLPHCIKYWEISSIHPYFDTNTNKSLIQGGSDKKKGHCTEFTDEFKLISNVSGKTLIWKLRRGEKQPMESLLPSWLMPWTQVSR